MNTLACVKRVPDTGAKIVLTDDQRGIDTSTLGFTMSPHEECALEEAVRIAEDRDGTATALTLGPEAADEQLRTALAMGADEATLLETGDGEWGPVDTATAIADYVADAETDFDLLLVGNESADAANYQVGTHLASRLDRPFVAGIKSLDVEDGTAIAKREVAGGEEVYEVDLPAVIAVKEGLNEPRYPSMRSKMRARKQEVASATPEPAGADCLEMVRLESPDDDEGAAEILGESADAADDVLEVLRDDVEVL
ncbi:electron transfer flavoprotein subunit beta/FixA family protein [Halopenitus sp. POP-27]|uniref:electron transfer flavoprotein subunit beta/FixA family protein n=1 Tax=Halopenitus sp. POP-27 TaxID=2994425 RepID=UPI002468600B|nr:electron transfer flavoprotein subunit beta/FixA family protein [Halopenitus sp. POP-27]